MNHDVEKYILESAGRKTLDEIRPDEKEKFFSRVEETFGFQYWNLKRLLINLFDEILIALKIRKRK